MRSHAARQWNVTSSSVLEIALRTAVSRCGYIELLRCAAASIRDIGGSGEVRRAPRETNSTSWMAARALLMPRSIICAEWTNLRVSRNTSVCMRTRASATQEGTGTPQAMYLGRCSSGAYANKHCIVCGPLPIYACANGIIVTASAAIRAKSTGAMGQCSAKASTRTAIATPSCTTGNCPAIRTDTSWHVEGKVNRDVPQLACRDVSAEVVS